MPPPSWMSSSLSWLVDSTCGLVPLNLQDGTVYLADGVVATDQQIWYLPQLLEGMEGQSVSQ